jgi:hypothetical protein
MEQIGVEPVITGAQYKGFEGPCVTFPAGPDGLEIPARVKAAQQGAVQFFTGNHRRRAIRCAGNVTLWLGGNSLWQIAFGSCAANERENAGKPQKSACQAFASGKTGLLRVK